MHVTVIRMRGHVRREYLRRAHRAANLLLLANAFSARGCGSPVKLRVRSVRFHGFPTNLSRLHYALWWTARQQSAPRSHAI